MRRAIKKELLPRFERYLIEDGWTIQNRKELNQAVRACKPNFKGDKKKWCVINLSPNIDDEYCPVPNFSEYLVNDFHRKIGLV